MDLVLGMSMAPSTVRMVLVEGKDGDGATVDQDGFPVATAANTGNAATLTAANQAMAAILGTREGATQGGYRLASTGVTCVDSVEADALRDALAAHRVENIMLVSAFLAAAALAQSFGTTIGYAHTGLLFIEPECATLAVVDSASGSITDVRKASLPVDDADAVAELRAMAAGVGRLTPSPQGLFVVGSDGVDVGLIKAELEAATPLTVSAPTEPDRRWLVVRRWRPRTHHCPIGRPRPWRMPKIPAPGRRTRSWRLTMSLKGRAANNALTAPSRQPTSIRLPGTPTSGPRKPIRAAGRSWSLSGC